MVILLFGFTAHFVTKDWQRKTVFLSRQPFDGSHAGVAIAKALDGILDTWGLRAKLQCIVRDSDPKMVTAMESKLWPHASCFLHSLALVVDKAVLSHTHIEEMITRVEQIVTMFKRSSVAQDKLEEWQQINQRAKRIRLDPQAANPTSIPQEHRLIRNEPTRWNSTFFMLERFLEQKKSIEDALDDLPATLKKDKVIVHSDWSLMKSVTGLLKDFADATLYAEQENCCVSQVIPILYKLYCKVNSLPLPGVARMQEALKIKLDNYFCGHSNKSQFLDVERTKMFTLATILDPRYKTKYFRSRACAALAKIELENEVKTALLVQDPASTDNPPNAAVPSSSKDGFLSDLSNLAQDHNRSIEDASGRTGEQIVEEYLRDPAVPECPLMFWRVNQTKWPELSEV